MKTYNVEMEMTFKKMLRVAAPTADDAIDLAEHLMEEPDVFCFDRSELSETEVGVRPVDTDEFCFCRCMACEDAACCGCCMEDDENEDYEEDRIDELLCDLQPPGYPADHRAVRQCDLQDTLEAANEAMADVLIIAEELKELTGEDILSQLLSGTP